MTREQEKPTPPERADARLPRLDDDGPAFSSLASGARIGQYELIRQLARAGTGQVFLARDIRLGRLVKIKLLARQSRQLAERFLADARATALCRHENIVAIHDAGDVDGQPYTVFEYLDGPTLRAWLWRRRGGRAAAEGLETNVPAALSVDLALELMVPVVRALAHAHGLGIVHRNLWPGNIVLSEAGAIKVLEFDNADLQKIAARSPGSQEPDEPVATDAPADRERGRSERAEVEGRWYLSPEQSAGGAVDPGSDIWAVGIMLYELVTGRHPLAPLSRERLATLVEMATPMPRLSESHPQLGPLAAIVDACLEKPLAQRMPSASALLERLEALLPERQRQELDADESPYTGLSAFQRSDANRFFGRTRDIVRLTARVSQHGLLAVTGPSGAGKSSLVRAGLIPALERMGEDWHACIVRPGRRPLRALDAVAHEWATGAGDRPAASLEATWRERPGHLGALLRATCRQRGCRILLFVDQFEELYSMCTDEDERSAFIACLEGVADDPSSPLRVLIAMRSDFLDYMAGHRQFMTRVVGGLIFLSPMGRADLREALTRPLERVGYRFESDEMVEDMLETLESTRSPLPLLQFTAAKLWEERDVERRWLTRQSYRDLGGIGGALAAHADAVLAGFSRAQRRLARAMLLRLVTPERTRASVSIEEMRQLSADEDRIERMMHELAGARLILLESGSEQHGMTMELVHESLIERWPTFAQWLEESAEDTLFLARVREAAGQWEAHGRSEGMLWSGATARDAEEWLMLRTGRQSDGDGDGDSASGLPVEMGQRDQQFLEAVVELSRRVRRWRRRWLGLAFAVLGAVAIVVSFLAVHAAEEAERAERQAVRADRVTARVERQKQAIARSALRVRNATRMATAREHLADPTTVLALVREVEPGHLPRGWSDLARLALHSGVARSILAHPDAVRRVAFSPDGTRVATASVDHRARVFAVDRAGAPLLLEGHGDRVYGVAFSPDGTLVATASADRTARIHRADTGALVRVLEGHGARVYSVYFSPDGRRIATASADKSARVWQVRTGASFAVLQGHGDRVYTAAFSPDGTRVVTASGDRTARSWDVAGTGPEIVFQGHADRVHHASFSPDGLRIATASADRSARIWNADGSGSPQILQGHLDVVHTADFSPDGGRLVTASLDKTARVYQLADGRQTMVLQGHDAALHAARFSPDGRLIATASNDRSARLWRADGSDRPLLLRGHRDRIYTAVFSPDGRRILTASADRMALLHPADGVGRPIALAGHRSRVRWAAFSPDGTRIATASRDTTARVWHADGSGVIAVLAGHTDMVLSAAFSPDGARIVTASDDQTARIWPADGSGPPEVLGGRGGRLRTALFTPDGHRIATASYDAVVRLWPFDGAGEPTVLRGHERSVHSIAFSPDGTRMVTASDDGTARIWPLVGDDPVVVLRGHQGPVRVHEGGAFSPDGARVVTGSMDKTVRVWNADGSGEPLVLRGPDQAINNAAFSPDGRQVVAAADDDTAWVWRDLSPLSGLDDRRLWQSSSYCMPIERRMRLLGVSSTMAETDLAHCRREVQRAREETRGER